ncbi:PDZ domain-containing protein [Helcobacillus massiliensis]|uniref:endopeptidase La n=1 Tax=Helcobacillus massiliensis TaxID=521392 RepID=A0A839R229_9MICO|nr:PDZ domain-containing protein [Helcobacillus massiliensis]
MSSPAPVPQQSRRISARRSLIGSIALIALCVLTLIATLTPSPYVIESAGPTVDVLGEVDGTQVIEVKGSEPEKPDGQLRMTTVAVLGAPGQPAPTTAVFAAWFDPTKSILPREAVYPDTQDEEGSKLMTSAQMSSSQQEAIAVALAAQGMESTPVVRISGVRSDGPAAQLLKPGDRVVSVNGTESDEVPALQKATADTPAGGTADFVVERDGKRTTVSVPVEQKDGRSVVGIVLTPGFDFPVDVRIALDGIGGPSAGLIFALGIYDEMTPGSLTGGKRIAGTGTIDQSGAVGPIGGIRQKLVGAKEDGAEFFLAPADNCAEVVGHVPDGLSVVRVSTFEDAKHAVETIADSGSTAGLPTCTASERT